MSNSVDLRGLISRVETLKNWSNEQYAYFHQNPELSRQEVQTSRYCQRALGDLGYAITKRCETGFTADLVLDQKLPWSAFRTDMDALPTRTEQQKNELGISSNQVGVAHLCGHDLHMTIALTIAKVLIERRNDLSCNVRFIFQPSEEDLPGGALEMIQAGSLEGISKIIGFHNDPNLEVGTVATRPGYLTMAGALFEITLWGKGGHSSRPSESLNPIYGASQLIQKIESLSLELAGQNSQYPVIVALTKVDSGSAPNIIPDQLRMTGTIRYYAKSDLEKTIQSLQAMLQPLIANDGYRAQVEVTHGYPSVHNHEDVVTEFIKGMKSFSGPFIVDEKCHPVSWAEDFSYYLEKCPGALILIGSGHSEAKKNFPLHSPKFNPNLRAIQIGAACGVQFFLNQKMVRA